MARSEHRAGTADPWLVEEMEALLQTHMQPASAGNAQARPRPHLDDIRFLQPETLQNPLARQQNPCGLRRTTHAL